MGLNALITPFPWNRYSKKLAAKIDKPQHVGFLTKEEAEARDLRLVLGKEGAIEEGNIIQLYWLVDKDDGIIVDARFQVFGQSVLMGGGEIVCELVIGKNYDQARRISADLIDKQVRDKSEVSAFPRETYPHLNLILGALDMAADQCLDIPLSTSYVAPPMPLDIGEVREGGYPGWQELSLKQKLGVIEEVLNNEIRPYIALDGGGVEVLNLVDNQVIISYQGACTSCYSSIGTTLSYIQQMIRAKVHPELNVTPELPTTF